VRILLVGSTGFIGRRIKERLRESGHIIYETSRGGGDDTVVQLIPYEKMRVEKLEIEMIINAAGKYNASADPNLITSNVGIAQSISMTAPHVSRGILNIGSYFELLPMDTRDGSLLYTYAKREVARILEKSARENDLSFANVYLYDNFDADLSRKKFFDCAILAATSGTELTIRNGSKKINLLPIKEIVSALDCLVSDYCIWQDNSRIEMKSVHSHSITDTVRTIEKWLGLKVHLKDLQLRDDNRYLPILENQSHRFPWQRFEWSLESHLAKFDLISPASSQIES
jgi:nucleoside-diphosphate-sugar epimerase